MPARPRVLVIGESVLDVAVDAQLARGGSLAQTQRAATAEALLVALEREWDLAIAHFAAGRFGACEALQLIHERDLDLPVIVISGKVNETTVAQLLESGAADCLTRASLPRLNAVVEREHRAALLRRERAGLEEQFRQAQKMEAVGRLAGGVAHDFNNLLTIITGYSGMVLADKELKEAHRSSVDEIRRAAERGGALAHQLLAFSRRQPMQARTVKLNQLVVDIQKLLEPLIGEDIKLLILPAAAQDLVHADPGRLEQVIMNLAVNARDAMPQGGTLSIETAAVEEIGPAAARQMGVKPGLFVPLTISDTGVGMDKATLSHMFEPFFTTKPRGRGTGLGLATAYGIIRQSGGSIAITSAPGQGTAVRIRLPLASQRLPEPVAKDRAAASTGGAETILLVEDEPRVRKLVRDVLGGCGYHVLEATRGEEALRLCRSYAGRIHLLLADVIMPEMSGPDVVKEVVRLRPDTSVLYMSGYTDEAMVHHGIEGSGAAFLPKPFLPESLARKVREVLDASSGARPGE